jgi:hypothetical protein
MGIGLFVELDNQGVFIVCFYDELSISASFYGFLGYLKSLTTKVSHGQV